MAKKVKPGKLRGNTVPNKLTADENDWTLNLLGGMSYSLPDLAQLVVQSGITTLTVEQLVDAFRKIMEKGIEMTLMGNNISFEYFLMRIAAKGRFDSANEPFTRPKHSLTAVLSPGSIILDALKETLVENMGPAQHFAMMDTIINTVNGETNFSLTPGQVLEIKGVNLSILGDHPDVGIYLQEVGAADSARIKATTLLNNEPKRLMFMVPSSVAVGKNYQIVHISQAGASKSKNGNWLKEPRTEHSISLKATDGTTGGGGEDDRPVID